MDHVLAAFACMLMSGPLLAGFTQTINDYYDREIDAINEPYRPIPSGAIPLGQVKLQIWVCLLYTSPSPRDRQKSRMPSSA